MNQDQNHRSPAEEIGIQGPFAQVRIVPAGSSPTRFALRGDIIARIGEHYGRDNSHKIAIKAGTAYSTARTYMIAPGMGTETQPEKLGLDLEKFFDILIRGVGIPWERLANLPFGAIFAVVVEKEETEDQYLVLMDGLVDKEETEQ